MRGTLITQIMAGKSLLRALMNLELAEYVLEGQVLDIGGGHQPSYLRYFQNGPEMRLTTLDINPRGHGDVAIDLEEDSLPYENHSVDQALLFNLLEHIYHHQHVVREVARVLRPGGMLIGFVPFLINYHPDPHDYFRYTNEALIMILEEAGFRGVEIKAIGRGPFAVNYNTIASFLPKVCRVILLWPHLWCDRLVLKLRPAWKERYPLGYLFTATR